MNTYRVTVVHELRSWYTLELQAESEQAAVDAISYDQLARELPDQTSEEFEVFELELIETDGEEDERA